MATQALVQPIFFKSGERGGPSFYGGPEFGTETAEAASQTYTKGQLVYIDTNGDIAVASSAGSPPVSDSKLLGFAMKAGQNNSSAGAANTFVRKIHPDDVYIMNVYHTTGASAVTNQNQVGTLRAITLVSSQWHCDLETTVTGAGSDSARVKIIGFPATVPVSNTSESVAVGDKNTIGDTYGFVFVKFLQYAADTDGDPTLANILQG